MTQVDNVLQLSHPNAFLRKALRVTEVCDVLGFRGWASKQSWRTPMPLTLFAGFCLCVSSNCLIVAWESALLLYLVLKLVF